MIEEVLINHLRSQSELESYLAKYNNELAVFNQEAPSDNDELWNDKTQYGRIVFALDMSDDPERKYSGTLNIDVMSLKNCPIEELEQLVRELVDGYFFSTDEVTMAAQWNASNYFSETTDKIIGVTITFGLLAFTKQTSIEPDPINLLNKWASEELSNILETKIRVIGYDTIDSVWKPTPEAPAIYWRLANIASCEWIPDTYSCSWLTATIYGHILAQDKNKNTVIARTIENVLTIKKRLIFDDNSPLMVDRNIRVNLGSDQLRTGQITIDATYGILTSPKPYNPIKNIYF